MKKGHHSGVTQSDKQLAKGREDNGYEIAFNVAKPREPCFGSDICLREVKVFFTGHLIPKTISLFLGSETVFGTMFLARRNEKKLFPIDQLISLPEKVFLENEKIQAISKGTLSIHFVSLSFGCTLS